MQDEVKCLKFIGVTDGYFEPINLSKLYHSSNVHNNFEKLIQTSQNDKKTTIQ